MPISIDTLYFWGRGSILLRIDIRTISTGLRAEEPMKLERGGSGDVVLFIFYRVLGFRV